MPISNSLINFPVTEITKITEITQIIEAPPPPPVVFLETTDPLVSPIRDRIFWLNTITNQMWIAKGIQSISDWVPFSSGGSGGSGADLATILGAIVVENNAVLTDGKNVIYEAPL
jgi:hypothetical protein